MHRISLQTVIAAGLCLLAPPAFAAHNEPVKARTLEGDLVTAYEPCTVPNTMTEQLVGACSPAVRSDESCGFGPKGVGNYKLAIKPDRSGGGTALVVRAALSGLDAGCEGAMLEIVVFLTQTTDDCGPSGPCTTAIVAHAFPSFVPVTDGGVEFNLANLSGIPRGGRTGLGITSVLVRNSATGRTVFVAGLLEP